jgi:hypothetical protein
MNESVRFEILSLMAELSRRHPQWRFGQLVANVAGWADADVWDVEDEALLMALRNHLAVAVSIKTSNHCSQSPAII